MQQDLKLCLNGAASNPKGITPAEWARIYPNEHFLVNCNKIFFCNAWRE